MRLCHAASTTAPLLVCGDNYNEGISIVIYKQGRHLHTSWNNDDDEQDDDASNQTHSHLHVCHNVSTVTTGG